jgi:hypothetical protein
VKTNIFIVNDKDEVEESGLREAGGNRAVGFAVDPEEEFIQDIDEEKMTPEKILATRFLNFLGGRQLTMEKLRALPTKEQQRLKKEFLETN